MKEYEELKIEVLDINAEDVILTSGGVGDDDNTGYV